MQGHLRACAFFFICCAFFCISPTTVQSQIIVKNWDKTYGSNALENSPVIVASPDGGYLQGMNSNRYFSIWYFSIGTEYWVQKLNTSGGIQWEANYGSWGTEHFTSLVNTPDGGYLIGGYSNSNASKDKSEPSKGQYDYWVIKIDRNGVKQWDRTYGGSLTESLRTIIPTTDGYVLVGTSMSGVGGDKSSGTPATGENDIWAVKIDLNGNKVWDKSFDYGPDNHFRSASPTSDGGLFICATVTDYYTPGSRVDLWLIKLNYFGTTEWTKNFYDINYPWIVEAPDGGFMLAGSRGNYLDTDFTAIKLAPNGHPLWQRNYGGTGHESLKHLIRIDEEGGFLLGGESTSPKSREKSENSRGGADFWVLMIDGNGNKKWDKTLGGSSEEYLNRMLYVSNTYLISGSSFSNISGDKTANKLGYGDDVWTVKLAEFYIPFFPIRPIGISVYPNPASESLTISREDPSDHYQVKIYNKAGRLINESKLEGMDLRLRVENYPEDFYFIHLYDSKGSLILKKQIKVNR